MDSHTSYLQGREAILRVHGRDKRIAPDADYNKIARATGGFTGAQLMAIMNTAAIAAVRRGSKVVTTDDMLNVRPFCLPSYRALLPSKHHLWHLYRRSEDQGIGYILCPLLGLVQWAHRVDKLSTESL